MLLPVKAIMWKTTENTEYSECHSAQSTASAQSAQSARARVPEGHQLFLLYLCSSVVNIFSSQFIRGCVK